MKCCGIEVPVRTLPKLDPSFTPFYLFQKAFLQSAGTAHPVGIAIERADGLTSVMQTYIHGTKEQYAADCYYIDRLVKIALWMKGGFRIYVSDSHEMYEYLHKTYAKDGARSFDYHFMGEIYEHPFEVLWTEHLPEEKNDPQKQGGHTDGCRIGFDAGGSDRKVSAVIDGESVFDEEVVWFPKTNEDPDYHYDGIVSALKAAAAHLPRVDAVGVSSAGIYIHNRTMRASLFNTVPADLFEEKVKDIYIRAITDTFGDIPFAVANDGDVSALAGKLSLNENSVLGIAMGTSEAAGFVDENGCITGWLNELAFVPIDCSPSAMEDEWSTDIGCGVKYFSQDAVIKLAKPAGIELEEAHSPAEKQKIVQQKMEDGDPKARDIYESIGVYLGHTLAFYYDLYKMRHVLLLGRVMSGKGGDLILKTCREVLAGDYPALKDCFIPSLPDERFRRVGQSATAASLPALRKES